MPVSGAHPSIADMRVFEQLAFRIVVAVFRTCGGIFRRCGRHRAVGLVFGHECVLAAVGFALESDAPSVVDGVVDEGGGHVGIAQDAAPAAGFDVGGVDDAPCLIAVGDDLEEQATAFLVAGHVAELVDDNQASRPMATAKCVLPQPTLP